jgi:predicted TIM-barrel fold metal-dependent hydrolase
MAKRRIVDAHHHLWDLSHGYAYPWLQDQPASEGMLGNLAPIVRDYLVPDLLADMVGFELEKSVHIEAVPLDSLTEVRWLTKCAGRTGFPNAIVAHAGLDAPDVEALLASAAAFPQVKGTRQIANWHANPRLTFTPADLLQNTRWQAGYALLKKYDLSFDLQLYAGQMPEAATLAARNPETLVIINHAGMPVERDAQSIIRWRNGMQALANLDNVVAKISGLGMVERGWTTESIRPFVRYTIDCFGIDRVMFGSNFPVDRLYSSFSTLYSSFETIVSDLTEEEQDKLFRANAIRWYRII